MPDLACTTQRFIFGAFVCSLIGCGDAGSDEPLQREAETATGATAESDAAAVAAVAAREDALLGSNACKNADIRVLNSLAFPITVRSIDYYNGSETRWQHEDLSNTLVEPGAMEFWTPTFSNTDNDWIYSFDVQFDHDEDASGNPIPTHAHVLHINTPDQRCNTGTVYLLEIQ